MDSLKPIYDLIRGGANYLDIHRLCDEDGIPHGRRAYIWPLLAWLYRHDGDARWQGIARRTADELLPTVRKNATGETVIFPGLHHRRNYSTNAIDCGAFVDSCGDLSFLTPSHPIHKKSGEVAEYLFRKITGTRDVHDQYLWAATGLARFLEQHGNHEKAEVYRKGLEETLEFWMRKHDSSGFAPYMESDPFMGGLTPYYFSRRIAFPFYILEKAGISRPDIVEVLLRSARFLRETLRPDAIKEMRLEAKRYYFRGTYEVASHPFDIYVYLKAYEYTKESVWLESAGQSLRALLRAQGNQGGMKSRPETEGGMRDWQCDTMRTGHLVWLTRIPDALLKELVVRQISDIRIPPQHIEGSSTVPRVLRIGTAKNWIHFVTKKGPLAGYAGERQSGIIAGTSSTVNALTSPALFHYRARNNPLAFLKHNRRAIVASFRYALIHAWDSLVYKKEPLLAWAIMRDDLLGYLYTGLFVVSTEFTTELTGLTLKRNELFHDLTLADMSGKVQETIGTRRINWNEKEITITDTLTSACRVRFCRLQGTRHTYGPTTIETRHAL